MVKILFVCECNICRSPMSEFILKYMTKERNDIEISSAGVSGFKAGSPMYSMARECLESHGIPVEDRAAVKFKPEEYFSYDYIICMDEWNKYNLKRSCFGDPENKVFKLLEFSDRSTEGMSADDAMVYTDVFDPYQDKNFERAYKTICEGCNGLIKKVIEVQQ